MPVLVKGEDCEDVEATVAGDTRDRMIEATVDALQHRGLAGMSFTEVLAASGAARGAIYHHFPGGKVQLAAEAAERNGRQVCAHLAELPAGSPVELVDGFLAAVRPVLAGSAEGGGCAVAAVTVTTGSVADDATLRETAAAALSCWVDRLAERLTVAGLPAGEAGDLAQTLITLLQGAHVMCRAAGSVEPFDRAARTAAALVACRYPVGSARM